MAIDIKDLGITEEELIERVVARIAASLLHGVAGHDEDGEPYMRSSEFSDRLQERVKERIDEAIDNVAAKHVLPNMESYIEGFCIQATNEWGEKRGEEVTFVQYLTQRAEAWLGEPVDGYGKTREEARSSMWSKSTNRITYLVDRHLKYHIEKAMKDAYETASSGIVEGLKETIEYELDKLKEGMTVALTEKNKGRR